jgi:hypothetical protein
MKKYHVNNFFIVGSSETTREVSKKTIYKKSHLCVHTKCVHTKCTLSEKEKFRISAQKNEVCHDITKLNQKFISWFVGFFEADGCFIVNKDKYLEFRITQSSRDAQVLFYIKKSLGFGVVRKQYSVSNTHCFRVRDKKGIASLITIFNNYGCFFTSKSENQFNHWVNSYNLIYKTNMFNYTLCSCVEKKLTLNDAWLSGFTDGEGCFTVSVCKERKTKTASYTQVQVRYIISQKNHLNLMQNIAILLNGKVHFLKSYCGYNMVVNLTKLKTIINYLNNYPLKTKKLISYKKWLKVYYLVVNKKHLIAAYLEKIKILQKTINI